MGGAGGRRGQAQSQLRSSNNHRKGAGEGRFTRGHGNSRSIQCYNCNRLAHYALDCWSKPTKQDEQSNFVEARDEEKKVSMVLLAQEGYSQENVWYLDSGEQPHVREE